MSAFARRLAAIAAVGFVVRVIYAWVRRDVVLWGDAFFYGTSAQLIEVRKAS